MRVLVTGGGRFIGSHVVRRALDRGSQVTVLDNFSTGYRENLPPSPSLSVIEGDIRRVEDLDRALSEAGAVFHLAASVGNVRSIERPEEDAEVNVLGTVRLLERMRKVGVGRLIYSLLRPSTGSRSRRRSPRITPRSRTRPMA